MSAPENTNIFLTIVFLIILIIASSAKDKAAVPQGSIGATGPKHASAIYAGAGRAALAAVTATSIDLNNSEAVRKFLRLQK